MILDPLLFDENNHADALEQLTLRALNAGEYSVAFRYADRRCRIPPIAKPHHYALRAEAAYQCFESEAAIADLVRALELAPDNLAANRRMLAWAEGSLQLEAARRLIRQDRDMTVLATAIKALIEAGEGPFAAIEHTDDQITGWATWSGDKPLRITIGDDDDATTSTIADDPSHPLHDCLGCAAHFSFKRPGSGQPVVVSIKVGRKTILEKRMRGIAQTISSGAVQPKKPRPGAAPEISLTVIVPIYDDFEATKECLDSLLMELNGLAGSRAILIDDASPDSRIRDHLDSLKQHKAITIISNSRNFGFVESVNQALGVCPTGDVVLLNADTVLPPGCLGRLRDAAMTDLEIGTVTPLSNNGEFTSFPTPNEPNPIPLFEDIRRIDETAATANAGAVIDIPNGIGFCLYVSRSCLDAVGPLSDVYYRGYFEDVDLCLRARELGFRNVCVPSVYIGHVGSRSFGTQKRSLVVQNLAVLEARFPRYRAECAAFVSADPLRGYRAAIEHALAPEPGATMLTTGSGPLLATAKARAGALDRAGTSAFILEIRTDARGPTVHVIDPKMGIPQSLAFRLSDATERSALDDYLTRARLARIEIVDPAHIPAVLLDMLTALETPLDIFIADAGLVCPRGSFALADGTPCPDRSGTACKGCVPLYEGNSKTTSVSAWRSRWAQVTRKADRIITPCGRARDFAARFLPERQKIEVAIAASPNRSTARSGEARIRRDPPPVAMQAAQDQQPSLLQGEKFTIEDETGGTSNALGFLAVTGHADDYVLMRDVGRMLAHDYPDQQLVVLGRTIDDLGLMRLGHMVTGSIQIDEFEHVLHQYGISSLFIAVRRPLFGHPVVSRVLAGPRPIAFLDWSFGDAPCRNGDLAIDPDTTNAAIAHTLGRWIAHQ